MKSVKITPKLLPDYLGTIKFLPDDIDTADHIGIANGLAYTSVGGELLKVEVNVFPGTGKTVTTGSLGDVMKESAGAAVSYIRANAHQLGVDPLFYKDKDIHIHFPEGAVPKDGPSAGITLVTALISELTGIPVRGKVAMTGEVTLKGQVLPIGGLKEKTMAAAKNGMTTVLIPAGNERNLADIDPEVRAALEFIPVKTVDEVLAQALVKRPTPKKIKTDELKLIPADPSMDGVYLNQ